MENGYMLAIIADPFDEILRRPARRKGASALRILLRPLEEAQGRGPAEVGEVLHDDRPHLLVRRVPGGREL